MKICWARPQLEFTFDNRFSRTGCTAQQSVRYIILRVTCWLLPLQDGNLSAHLTTKRSVVIRHLLILHDISFLYGMYLTLHTKSSILRTVWWIRASLVQIRTSDYQIRIQTEFGSGSKSGFRSYYYSQ
jgi:hypothetical protein